MSASDSKTDNPPGKNKADRRRRAYPKGRRIDPAPREEIAGLIGDERRRDLLIEYLHLIQDRYGRLSAAHMAALAGEMGLAQAEVYETATFYSHFVVLDDNGEDHGKPVVRVCDGISCKMAGADGLAKKINNDGQARVKRTPCVGACDKAPVSVADIYKGGAGLAVPDYPDFEAYRAGGGYRALGQCLSGGRTRRDMINDVEASGLRGLGGAGFPEGRKWRFLLDQPKPRLMVVNADEGEPGTFKDRHCLENNPHRVIEGALIAAWAVEADEVYIYLRDEYPQIREILLREIPKAEAGLDGPDRNNPRIHLRRGAGSYVCGEETALIESIEGKRGLPRNRPPYPAQSGLFGLPTLVNNVETLFWVKEIAERGAGWYIEAGRPRLYSVSGRVREPGVKLAPAGTTVNQLIEDYSGGMAEGHVFKAYLPGGASGGILPAALGDLRLDFGALEAEGCFVGSAAVVVMSEADDMAETARDLMRFLADESCGQCTPCRLGTEKMLRLIEPPSWDKELIKELSQVMREASICGLGQAAPNPVLSVIRHFAGEIK